MDELEILPDCNCIICGDARPNPFAPDGFTIKRSRTIMVLCPKCGNKRCPHATYHKNECTGSNASGQPGSRFGPRELPPMLGEKI